MDSTYTFNFSACSSPLSHPYGCMHVPPSFLVHQTQPSLQIGEPTNAMELKKEHIRLFWLQRMLEITQVADFKQHQLPIARIKRVMKADEEVKMISADAPVLFSKACELFILELTLRSWLHTEENKRRTLQRSDIAHAIAGVKVLDFLLENFGFPFEDFHGQEQHVGGNWMPNSSFPEFIMSNEQEVLPQYINQQLLPSNENRSCEPYQGGGVIERNSYDPYL